MYGSVTSIAPIVTYACCVYTEALLRELLQRIHGQHRTYLKWSNGLQNSDKLYIYSEDVNILNNNLVDAMWSPTYLSGSATTVVMHEIIINTCRKSS